MCKIEAGEASIELERLKISYRNTPYEELPKEGDKRIYLVGQECYGKRRAKLLIDNDYVLTDDEGRYIHTEQILPREFLMSLSQKQIQNSDNPAHIFLPMPRAEAIYRGLRMIEDKNNIPQYYKKGDQDD